MQTITVLYTCDKCGTVDRPCKVEARQDGQPLQDWMQVLGHALLADHTVNSPFCKIKELAGVKIPHDGNDPTARVGAPAKSAFN